MTVSYFVGLMICAEGVGKTSIIVTLISDQFPRLVQKTYNMVTIGPDPLNSSNKNVYTQLIDTSSSKNAEQQTDELIEKANVIVLVYDVNSVASQQRVKTYWMPRISKIDDKVPVIYVGNKLDLRSTSADNEMKNLLKDHFEKFNQVQIGIECSARLGINIINIINLAQRAVLYPIPPLYDSIEKQLKEDYQRALLRIFRICDKDGDGVMDD